MSSDNWRELATVLFLCLVCLAASVAIVDCTVTASQHTKDPTKCTKVCVPPGWEGELPKEFPDDAELVECQGDYCARAEHAPPEPDDPQDDPCRPHYSCSVHCSEVCCVCLRECI